MGTKLCYMVPVLNLLHTIIQTKPSTLIQGQGNKRNGDGNIWLVGITLVGLMIRQKFPSPALFKMHWFHVPYLSDCSKSVVLDWRRFLLTLPRGHLAMSGMFLVVPTVCTYMGRGRGGRGCCYWYLVGRDLAKDPTTYSILPTTKSHLAQNVSTYC